MKLAVLLLLSGKVWVCFQFFVPVSFPCTQVTTTASQWSALWRFAASSVLPSPPPGCSPTTTPGPKIRSVVGLLSPPHPYLPSFRDKGQEQPQWLFLWILDKGNYELAIMEITLDRYFDGFPYRLLCTHPNFSSTVWTVKQQNHLILQFCLIQKETNQSFWKPNVFISSYFVQLKTWTN